MQGDGERRTQKLNVPNEVQVCARVVAVRPNTSRAAPSAAAPIPERRHRRQSKSISCYLSWGVYPQANNHGENKTHAFLARVPATNEAQTHTRTHACTHAHLKGMLSKTAKAPFATWSGVPKPSPREPAARALTNATSASRSFGPLPSYGPLDQVQVQVQVQGQNGSRG